MKHEIVKKMKFEVFCCGGTYHVQAHSWSVGSEGLKFKINDSIIAWFTTFDYWIYKGDVE